MTPGMPGNLQHPEYAAKGQVHPLSLSQGMGQTPNGFLAGALNAHLRISPAQGRNSPHMIAMPVCDQNTDKRQTLPLQVVNHRFLIAWINHYGAFITLSPEEPDIIVVKGGEGKDRHQGQSASNTRGDLFAP